MIPLLRSPHLDVPHGFSTREGGVSQGPYATLNLGRKVGDAPEAVAENRRRFHAATGAAQLAHLDQVHGDVVRMIAPGDPALFPASGQTAPESVGDADASVTQVRGVGLCIGTADCLPILIHAPDAGAIGAAHAGWRGADLRIGARTVEALAGLGARPAAMRAVLGPCIRRCCYEVSGELAARFEKQFGPGVVDRSRPAPHLDIALASRLALEAVGIPSEAIDDLGLCTHCDAARFFSHRRDRGTTGRMLAFIARA